MVRQTVFPFKLEATDDMMTAQAGLVVFGEFLRSLNLAREIDRAFGKPGSGAGYRASSSVLPLLLMLQGGGRSLEDLRMIARDKGLLALLAIGEVPSTDAFGRWLRTRDISRATRRLRRRLEKTTPRNRCSGNRPLPGDRSAPTAHVPGRGPVRADRRSPKVLGTPSRPPLGHGRDRPAVFVCLRGPVSERRDP